jgi:hypothetical protein
MNGIIVQFKEIGKKLNIDTNIILKMNIFF